MIEINAPKAPANEDGIRIILRRDLHKYSQPKKIINQAGGELIAVYYTGDTLDGETV